jgi:Acetyltransferase (GNAT) domain
MKIEREPYEAVDWRELDAFGDRTFSQRRAWLDFVAETQSGEPVIARILDGCTTAGFFTGIIVRRMGLRIIGSPFPGWTTPFMGLNMAPGASRADAMEAIVPFVFRDLGCRHLEIADPLLTRRDMETFEAEVHVRRSFRSDLTMSVDTLFSGMESACRRCIRKAEKSGVTIEAADPAGFDHEYYGHLEDVFAKQNLRPTYGAERVAALIRHVHPTGDLLLLRARDGSGTSIATGIFAGFNTLSYFWGNGSLRQHQILRPNELIHWHALRTFKARGMHWHYWGGDGEYKRKYGGEEVLQLEFRLSRSRMIAMARDLARATYHYSRLLTSTSSPVQLARRWRMAFTGQRIGAALTLIAGGI